MPENKQSAGVFTRGKSGVPGAAGRPTRLLPTEGAAEEADIAIQQQEAMLQRAEEAPELPPEELVFGDETAFTEPKEQTNLPEAKAKDPAPPDRVLMAALGNKLRTTGLTEREFNDYEAMKQRDAEIFGTSGTSLSSEEMAQELLGVRSTDEITALRPERHGEDAFKYGMQRKYETMGAELSVMGRGALQLAVDIMLRNPAMDDTTESLEELAAAQGTDPESLTLQAFRKELENPTLIEERDRKNAELDFKEDMISGGKGQAYAEAITNSGLKLGMHLLVMKALTGAMPGEHTSVLSKGSWAKNAYNTFRHSLKIASLKYVTTPGDQDERFQSAAIALAYASTPALATGMPTHVLALAADIGLNFVISDQLGVYEPAKNAAKAYANEHGGAWQSHVWMFLTPDMITDITTNVGFALHTRSSTQGAGYMKTVRDWRMVVKGMAGTEKQLLDAGVRQEVIDSLSIGQYERLLQLSQDLPGADAVETARADPRLGGDEPGKIRGRPLAEPEVHLNNAIAKEKNREFNVWLAQTKLQGLIARKAPPAEVRAQEALVEQYLTGRRTAIDEMGNAIDPDDGTRTPYTGDLRPGPEPNVVPQRLSGELLKAFDVQAAKIPLAGTEYAVGNVRDKLIPIIQQHGTADHKALADFLDLHYRAEMAGMDLVYENKTDPITDSTGTTDIYMGLYKETADGVSKQVKLNWRYMADSKEAAVETGLHEIIHGLTQAKLFAYDSDPQNIPAADREAFNALTQIRLQLQNVPDAEAPPGIKDILGSNSEFASEVMSSHALRDYLADKPGLTRGSLWQQFVDGVRKLLGIQPSQGALPEAERAIERIMNMERPSTPEDAAMKEAFASYDNKRNEAVVKREQMQQEVWRTKERVESNDRIAEFLESEAMQRFGGELVPEEGVEGGKPGEFFRARHYQEAAEAVRNYQGSIYDIDVGELRSITGIEKGSKVINAVMDEIKRIRGEITVWEANRMAMEDRLRGVPTSGEMAAEPAVDVGDIKAALSERLAVSAESAFEDKNRRLLKQLFEDRPGQFTEEGYEIRLRGEDDTVADIANLAEGMGLKIDVRDDHVVATGVAPREAPRFALEGKDLSALQMGRHYDDRLMKTRDKKRGERFKIGLLRGVFPNGFEIPGMTELELGEPGMWDAGNRLYRAQQYFEKDSVHFKGLLDDISSSPNDLHTMPPEFWPAFREYMLSERKGKAESPQVVRAREEQRGRRLAALSSAAVDIKTQGDLPLPPHWKAVADTFKDYDSEMGKRMTKINRMNRFVREGNALGFDKDGEQISAMQPMRDLYLQYIEGKVDHAEYQAKVESWLASPESDILVQKNYFPFLTKGPTDVDDAAIFDTMMSKIDEGDRPPGKFSETALKTRGPNATPNDTENPAVLAFRHYQHQLRMYHLKDPILDLDAKMVTGKYPDGRQANTRGESLLGAKSEKVFRDWLRNVAGLQGTPDPWDITLTRAKANHYKTISGTLSMQSKNLLQPPLGGPNDLRFVKFNELVKLGDPLQKQVQRNMQKTWGVRGEGLQKGEKLAKGDPVPMSAKAAQRFARFENEVLLGRQMMRSFYGERVESEINWKEAGLWERLFFQPLHIMTDNKLIDLNNKLPGGGDYFSEIQMQKDAQNRTWNFMEWDRKGKAVLIDANKGEGTPWSEARKQLAANRLMPYEERAIIRLLEHGQKEDAVFELAKAHTRIGQYVYDSKMRSVAEADPRVRHVLQYGTWWRSYNMRVYRDFRTLVQPDWFSDDKSALRWNATRSIGTMALLAAGGGMINSYMTGKDEMGEDMADGFVRTIMSYGRTDTYAPSGAGGLGTMMTPVNQVANLLAGFDDDPTTKGRLPSQVTDFQMNFIHSSFKASFDANKALRLRNLAVLTGDSKYEKEADEYSLSAWKRAADFGDDYASQYYIQYLRATRLFDVEAGYRNANWFRVVGDPVFKNMGFLPADHKNYDPVRLERSLRREQQAKVFLTGNASRESVEAAQEAEVRKRINAMFPEEGAE
jgi:hypothetical protein